MKVSDHQLNHKLMKIVKNSLLMINLSKNLEELKQKPKSRINRI